MQQATAANEPLCVVGEKLHVLVLAYFGSDCEVWTCTHVNANGTCTIVGPNGASVLLFADGSTNNDMVQLADVDFCAAEGIELPPLN